MMPRPKSCANPVVIVDPHETQRLMPANEKGFDILETAETDFESALINKSDHVPPSVADISHQIRRPTSSVAQANITIKTIFNILRSFSSSNILTIYLHALWQSLHPFGKNCVQGLPRDFGQNNPNTNKKFRLSFSATSHQLSFGGAKKEQVRGYQIWWIGE
jgi:hypothetical protein